ncbi:putative membrane-bound dehydrogenase domain protein [Fuerstiella marisgermanici]|uniref:Putative membrane-bound dehydrogenase domain protein n=2 Tax=Fuerstiella marisgermanici TaxID=1891926 RepID=A0A1P8WGG8_9PLAN|nr:putative membrane-bound dehydrogenase domain protein [Fuerstiella marisgermanici]
MPKMTIPFHQRIRLLAIVAAICTVAPTTFAQRDLKDIPIPDPELERATFKVPDGFEISLFAADPKIAKPIQMNFDEAGRLWIVSSEVYPHIEPGAKPSDRVVVLEDRDHDGVSDETHVFAEGLLIPTGIAPGDGGAYVANSTQLLHFADTDDDLKADSKRIVLSGFGTEDTHHILHTLRWGPDGYLYFNQSIYIHSHIETPWGVRRLNAGGIWQFRPETLELGVFMRGLVNTWGHHFDRFGQSFATDGAGGEGINYIVPGAYYFTAANAPQILHGLNPGSPKHCGLEIVETPMLPPDWQGSAITNDFRGHRVCRFNLSEDRSGFVSREQQEVVWSDHVAFRPIDVKLGPDGAIYIADWYNPIIQHGEVDFRDERRDHTHGRIWRVTWKGAPKREWNDLRGLKTTELLELLKSDDNFQRQAAKQLLRQRGDSILPELETWTAGIPNEPATEQLRLEALWCYQSLRSIQPELLQQLLSAEDHKVRAAAVRVLSHWKYPLASTAKDWLQRAVNDTHPRVRLEGVRATSFSPNADSELARATRDSGDAAAQAKKLAADVSKIEVALQATDHASDTFLDYAIWLTSRELSSQWLPSFEAGEIDFGGNVSHLLAAFSAVGKGAPVDFLLTRLYSPQTTDAQRQQATQLVAASGSAEQVAQMVALAITKNDPQAIQAALNQTSGRKLQVPLEDNAVTAVLSSSNKPLRQVGLKAVGQWKVANHIPLLTDVATQKDGELADRMAALDGLALSRAGKARNVLEATANDTTAPMQLRKHASAMLTGFQPKTAATVVAKLLPQMSVEDHPEDLMRSFLAVKQGDAVLAEALANTELDTDVAREMLRVVRESGRASAALEAALRTAGKITSRKSLSAEERAALLELAKTEVTAAEGEKIYRNEKLGCLKCHAIGGAGGKVGPDMVSLGGSAQPDYLLESLLDPNAKVKENYHTIVVVTLAGKLLSGVQVKQSDKEVVIRNAEDKLITIPRAEIDEIAPGLSLMPEGQVDALTDREVASLVRFLSELGRTPDFTISRRQLARTWTVMNATDEAAFRLRRTSYSMAATDDPAFTWKNQYSTVAGSLPLNDIPVVSVKNRSAAGVRGVGFTRCVLEAETPGTVVLKFNTVDGLKLRLNEVPVGLFETVTLDVTAGQHRLTFNVDKTERDAPLEVEIVPDGTTAVARFLD